MWSRGLLQMARRASTAGKQVGLLLDVDGVLVRGGSVIPAARRAFRKLVDRNNKLQFPVVFVTNAGSCRAQEKAAQLSHLLDVQVAPEQVVLSHSPLQMMSRFHDNRVLVSGQGPVVAIAHSLGFKNVVTIEDLKEQYPLLDMVEHKRFKPSSLAQQKFPRIDAIILFGEPIRWETNLQLLIDVLLTNGCPDLPYEPQPPQQLPVLACNMDLVWMAEAPSPRFGHGIFLLCLESVYRKITGLELKYEVLLGKPSLLTYQYAEHLLRQQNQNQSVSTIYAVGDNMMTDVFGANLYNRSLTCRATKTTQSRLASSGTGTKPVGFDTESAVATAECRSILVCTGVYNPDSLLLSHDVAGTVFHGHKDLVLDTELLEPRHVVTDVEAAVDLLLADL
ncbi:haloacid dehalogenase-like hydrolase domain-containing 5 [Synchiropus splendidus]|uniref:haloacid dehalogenase-like hydrolase domain-containing 5 n=1 Tax=Synchiropus splendidus TaxID=270530 RepID=UPI00237E9E61|nr:haloacid dehalogenase-like hydrolase domain-containing 5 [Synchiropus splendidus]